MQNRNIFGLLIIGVLFFIFGFITWANGTLIQYLKIACELSDSQSMYVASAFFAAYFVMALPSSFVLKKVGFKNGMSLGLIIMALGALLFIPAALQRNYSIFLFGLFIIGTGLTILQTASNPYVTLLGPIEGAARRISIMGICNKIAGILAIYILGNLTLKNADSIKVNLTTLQGNEKIELLNNLASRVIMPYSILASILIILAIIIYFLQLPKVEDQENEENNYSNNKTNIFQFPHLVLGALAIFFYVGVEVISYDSFAGYGEFLGYKLDEAKNFATYTGYALLLGYIFSIFAIPSFISQAKALQIFCVLSIIAIILSINTKGDIAVYSFAFLGFTNAVMWPAIWPLAIEDLGKYTKTGAALLIMGIIGGAILLPLYAKTFEWIPQIFNKQSAYLIMIPCYLFILFFAIKGHKLR